MDDPRILGPIPTPPSQRWREVRLLYLPRTVFALGVLLAVWLWSSSVAPATLIAEAEIEQAEVRAAQAGVITNLTAAMLQPVRAGEVLGHVAQANPRLLDATLSVIRAEVGMLAASMAGATDRQRNAIEFEKLQIDWMARRVELASLRGRLQQAESDLARGGPLHKAGLMTDDIFEQLKIARDSLVDQATEHSRMVAHLEPIVRDLSPRDEKDPALLPDAALNSAIKVQDAKLKLAEEQLMPMALIAPIDGVIAGVLRRPGENVTAGEAVLRITATRAERLTGFLRPPFSLEPKPGMSVEVRTRGAERHVATTKITEVGGALESIPVGIMAALRLPVSPPPEPALRIQFAIPNGLVLRPGEHVDVTIH
jgi:multidrug resistance efflux pump